MPQTQAIFFDLGDTLVRISTSIENEICKRIGEVRSIPLQVEEYTRVYHEEWQRRSDSTATNSVKNIMINAAARERQYWENYFESLLPFLGIHSEQPELIKWLIDTYTDPYSFVCFDDVYPVLSKLIEKELTLGIISNAFPSAERILNQLKPNDLPLSQYFKYIFLSFELPYAKPDIMLYQFAAEKAGIPIENIVFVDDRWNFVRGARDANMNAWLIERSADFPSTTKSLVQKIKSLMELTEVLDLSKIDNRSQEEPSSAHYQGKLWNYCELPVNSPSTSFYEENNYAGRPTISTNFYSISK